MVGYHSTIFGSAGLEKTYDAQLTGLVSLRAGDELLRKFRDQAYNPSDVYTSLDVELQQAAADLLGDQRGAVVAIEPSTGRVLALVSSPTFNANRVADPATARRYVATLQERTDSPLLNRATQGLYVPGSVFKIVTAIAGLGSGSIQPTTTYPDQPAEYQTGFLVDGFRIHDFPRKVQTDHPLDFYEATEVSSNIWYAHAGLDIGAQNLVDWAARLGFGERIPFELPTSPSQVNGGDGALDGFGDRVELANAAYGQSEVLVTPLQMAIVASTIANDGLLMRPKLVDYLEATDGSVTHLDPQVWGAGRARLTAEVIGTAMQLAVEGPYGRSLPARPRFPACRRPARAARPSSVEMRRRTAGSSATRRPMRRRSPSRHRRGRGAGAQRAVPMAGQLMSRLSGPGE